MKNNKRMSMDEMRVGMRVKIGIPTYWGHWSKDRDKKLSWFKGKVIEKHEKTVVVNVYPCWFIGRMMLTKGANVIKNL